MIYFVVVLGDMAAQHSAPDACQARVPHHMVGVVIARNLCWLYWVRVVRSWARSGQVWGLYSADCKSACPGWDI
jgi:hypothetical protein